MPSILPAWKYTVNIQYVFLSFCLLAEGKTGHCEHISKAKFPYQRSRSLDTRILNFTTEHLRENKNIRETHSSYAWSVLSIKMYMYSILQCKV